MKSIYLFAIVLSGMLAACGGNPSSEDHNESDSTAQSSATTETQVEAQMPQVDNAGVLGYYVGKFKAEVFKKDKEPSYSNKINISIDSIVGDALYGHSVVAGNLRPFSGKVSKGNGYLVVDATEPGDDKYDGRFRFTITPDKNELTGRWTANDQNLAVTERSYTLDKKNFTYSPDLKLPENVAWSELVPDKSINEEFDFEMVTEDVLKVNPSNTKLESKDVENMYKGDLEIVRNSIYARHGYSFKTRRMRYIFDKYVDWYIPRSVNVTSELTKLELDNIELLKRYEAHAANYYDTYGR
ncbi:MAG: YARHG domain-containing protein [Flavobacteriales bacterium]|nr:YARHG domain-containing protein [Flavobacteriales bacterium]